MKHLKSTFFRIAISVLSLGLVTFAVRDKFLDALLHLTSIRFEWLAAALALNFISIFPVTFRTSKVLLIQGISIPLRRIYYLWTISLFFNLFLPSAVVGDIVKAYYIYKDSGKKMASVTSVLFDRFFGLTATIFIGSFAFLMVHNQIDNPQIGELLFWLVIFVFVAVLFIMSHRFSKPARHFLIHLCPKRFKDHLQRIFDIVDLYRKKRRDFIIAFAVSLLAQGIYILIMFLLAHSIHINLPIFIFFLFFPIIGVFSMVPSLGGLGVREAATVYLFQKFIPLNEAVAFSILADMFVYGVGAGCGVLYAIRGGASIQEIEQIENGA